MNCPHCGVRFDFHDCLTEPGAQPEDDDKGICVVCAGWWIQKVGVLIQYIPTLEEMKMAIPQIPASRERAAEDAKRKGKRLYGEKSSRN